MRLAATPYALLLCATLAWTQQTTEIRIPAPPDGLTQAAVGYLRTGGPGAVVTGAPYSAEAVTESTQALADGNRIVHRTSTKQYRDSEGRERRELSAPGLGGAPAPEPLQSILITDPVAGFTYSLDPKAKRADKFALPSIQIANAVAAAGPVQGAQISIEATSPQGAAAFGGQNVMIFGDRQVLAQRDPDAAAEELGTQTIEGVIAQGKRTKTVIPAGRMGNEKAFEIVDETWYSPELKMTVMSKHSDPRIGETVFKLTNINRAEPDRSLFQIPADYTVNDRIEGVAGERIQIIQREIHPQ
jgi:hypothetical protein